MGARSRRHGPGALPGGQGAADSLLSAPESGHGTVATTALATQPSVGRPARAIRPSGRSFAAPPAVQVAAVGPDGRGSRHEVSSTGGGSSPDCKASTVSIASAPQAGHPRSERPVAIQIVRLRGGGPGRGHAEQLSA